MSDPDGPMTWWQLVIGLVWLVVVNLVLARLATGAPVWVLPF